MRARRKRGRGKNQEGTLWKDQKISKNRNTYANHYSLKISAVCFQWFLMKSECFQMIPFSFSVPRHRWPNKRQAWLVESRHLLVRVFSFVRCSDVQISKFCLSVFQIVNPSKCRPLKDVNPHFVNSMKSMSPWIQKKLTTVSSRRGLDPETS